MGAVSFIIPTRLPSLNDYTSANRTHHHAGASMKRKHEDAICAALALAHIYIVPTPVAVEIDWYEPDARRDPDNVFFAVKFILDSLVRFGVIEGDSQKHIDSITHRLHVDKANPRIVVRLTPVDGD